jgi:hypothetical protein
MESLCRIWFEVHLAAGLAWPLPAGLAWSLPAGLGWPLTAGLAWSLPAGLAWPVGFEAEHPSVGELENFSAAADLDAYPDAWSLKWKGDMNQKWVQTSLINTINSLST